MKLPAQYSILSAAKRRQIRLEYIKQQDGKCCYCEGSLEEEPPKKVTSKPIKWSLFPRGERFLDYPVHLHHDHDTDLTIGAVHAYCNAVLWQYHGE